MEREKELFTPATAGNLHIEIREIMGAIVDRKDRHRFAEVNLRGRFARFKEFCFENPGAHIIRCPDCFRLVAIVYRTPRNLVADFDGTPHSRTCPRRTIKHKGDTKK